MSHKRHANESGGSSNRPQKRARKPKSKAGSSTDAVLLCDINELKETMSHVDHSYSDQTFVKFSPFEVDILKLNSSGDGMGSLSGYTAIVPFTIAGDRVRAKPYFINDEEKLLLCDLEEVLTASHLRDDSLVKCKYFGKCSGCQLQALSYEQQLLHKKGVVIAAFKNFSLLDSSLIPQVEDTIGSPLQYHYRTKITPHFDQPRRGFAEGELPQIGFNEKGRRKVLDIEECPIATEALNKGLTKSRKEVHENLKKYKRGATLLLRQNTTMSEGGALDYNCVTDSKEIITEYIGDHIFQSPAGAFFQNNNAIMPLLTNYVKRSLTKPASEAGDRVLDRYLVDAYCGSGLFSITCNEGFAAVSGVEISQDSVTWATKNAERNNVRNAKFLAGNAEALFSVSDKPSEFLIHLTSRKSRFHQHRHP